MSLWQWLFVFCNAGITMGYFFIAVAVAPFVDIPSRITRIAGVAFFLTCGITHLDHAVQTVSEATSPLAAMSMSHDMIPWHSVLNHVLQVVAVWIFVVGLYLHFVPRSRQSVRLRQFLHLQAAEPAQKPPLQ